MTRLLALKIELVADVPTGDFGEMTAAIKESAEIQRQVLARLRRIQMGGRWRFVIFKTGDRADARCAQGAGNAAEEVGGDVADEQRGLYAKYIVTKADGSPTDPEAEYLVLRLDKGEYVEACRRAALTFASWVCDANPRLFQDIVDWMGRLGALGENRQKLPSALDAIDRLGKADAEHPKPPST